MKTLLVAFQMVLSYALPVLVQLADRRWLTPEQRARVWNGASWGAAVYAFGPLSMLGWAWVTRKHFLALVLGLLAAFVLFVAIGLLTLGFAMLLGIADQLE